VPHTVTLRLDEDQDAILEFEWRPESQIADEFEKTVCVYLLSLHKDPDAPKPFPEKVVAAFSENPPTITSWQALRDLLRENDPEYPLAVATLYESLNRHLRERIPVGALEALEQADDEEQPAK